MVAKAQIKKPAQFNIPRKMVDEYGELKAQEKALKKRIEEIKKEFDDAGVKNGDTILGTAYIVQYSESPMKTLKTEEIKNDMPEDWLIKYTNFDGMRCTYKPIKVK